MKDTNALLDQLGKTIGEILAGGLQTLPPGSVKKMAALISGAGGHLRFTYDPPILTCELVLPETPDKKQLDPITVFALAPTMPVGSNAIN